ncbi:MAG: mechanosensitive ion channel family protein [Nitrospirota bacterium]|jgi:small-conductance mechanosensitive channel
MNIEQYVQEVGHWFLTSGLRIVLILILALVVLKAVKLLSRRLAALLSRQKEEDVEFQKRAETLSHVVQYALTVVVLVVAAMMLLKQFGVDIGPLLAAAGVVGLAVGFGAQTLVHDVISGFFILIEDQIRVGDVVQIADKGGLVEQVNLRMTILRDLAGNVHYVRNGQIAVVTNMTKEYSRYVFDVGVAYREDVDEVVEVIKEVDAGLRRDPGFKDDILEPIEILGLDQFGDSAIVIKARTKTMPIQQWRVGREFNRRLKKAFDERGIEIPFPHITLYMGEDKQGQAPPLRVALREKGGGAPPKP